jgi:hypothetical protein
MQYTASCAHSRWQHTQCAIAAQNRADSQQLLQRQWQQLSLAEVLKVLLAQTMLSLLSLLASWLATLLEHCSAENKDNTCASLVQ